MTTMDEDLHLNAYGILENVQARVHDAPLEWRVRNLNMYIHSILLSQSFPNFTCTNVQKINI